MTHMPLARRSGVTRSVLTRRYVTALGIIGVLMAGGYVAVDVMVRAQTDRATVLERSARQRTMVQRAAVVSQQLLAEGDTARRATLQRELSQIAANIEAAHNQAVHPAGGPARLSPAEQDIYLNPPLELEARIHEYLEAARRLAAAPDSLLTRENRDFRLLLAATSGGTTAALDTVVARIVADTDRALARTRTVARTTLMATLIALILVALLMFEPVVREVHRYAQLLEKANVELTRLSALDGLTEIANRRAFEERVDEEWRRAVRDSTWLALLMVDIDHFKPYNDRYGHLQGDDCLVALAHALSRTLNRPGDFVARYGGEEFAVILPDTDVHGAVLVAEKLRRRVLTLGIPHETSDVQRSVTISVGAAALIPTASMAVSDLIAEADEALYRAKKNGRNRVESQEVRPVLAEEV